MDDLAGQRLGSHLGHVAHPVAVDVAVEEAPPVERGHVGPGPVLEAERRLEEGERVDPPAGAKGLELLVRRVHPRAASDGGRRIGHGLLVADVVLPREPAPRARHDQVAVRVGSVLAADREVHAVVRPARDDLIVVRQGGRQGPLELDHGGILLAELDDPRVARPAPPELEPGGREGKRDLVQARRLERLAIAIGPEVAQDDEAAARANLRGEPLEIAEGVVDLLGLVPGEHAAVAPHLRFVGEPARDVVVVDHEPEPVQRHLGPGMDLVEPGRLGASALHGVVELGGLVEDQDPAGKLAIARGGLGTTRGAGGEGAPRVQSQCSRRQ